MQPNAVNNFVKVSQEHNHVVVKNAGGLRGLPGPAGAGLEIDGSVDNYSDLPHHLSESDAGVAYFVQADGLLYVWSGTKWPEEGEGAQFQGPRGIQGPQGVPGEPGEQGEKGDPGTPGADGFSPIITTETISGGIRINITDKNGTQSVDIDYKNIPDGAISTAKLANGAVTTNKLGSGAVTTDKLGSGAVTNAKIGSSAVKAANIDFTTMRSTFTNRTTDGSGFVDNVLSNSYEIVGVSVTSPTSCTAYPVRNASSWAIRFTNWDWVALANTSVSFRIYYFPAP